MVRNVMLQEQNTAYKLSYKTGMGFEENGNAIGWMTGWIEENRHVYPFVINFDAGAEADTDAIGKKLAKDILVHVGFFRGIM